MDVQQAPIRGNAAIRASRPPSRERIGQALGEWQARELRHMSRHPHCRGLSIAQLEDLYQETVLALLHRSFFNEEHLRNALRFGLSKRALHIHRDERRRSEILFEHAPEAHRVSVRRSEIEGPEQAALAREDGRIVLEFVAELTPLERHLYALEAEGMRYRAIAPILGVEVNHARRASRSLASKRQRFQLLYDTGRMCGYRAPTIRALIARETTSETLAHAAFAHLESCAACRAEHRTNARRLRASFSERAAALLPLPALAGHLSLLARLDLRVRSVTQRWLPGLAAGGSGVRERAIAAAAGSGVAAKLAAGAATVAVIAGGTLSGAMRHSHPAHPRAAHASRVNSQPGLAVASPAPTPQSDRVRGSVPSPGRRDTESPPVSAGVPTQGGFAFLGVPARRPAAPSIRARVASTGAPQHGQAPPQNGGGPFSP